jgi:hypothetical protein
MLSLCFSVSLVSLWFAVVEKNHPTDTEDTEKHREERQRLTLHQMLNRYGLMSLRDILKISRKPLFVDESGR